jgi:hypothetical protein
MAPRILGPQFVEAALVQALALVLDTLVGHADAGQILRIEELGPDGRAGCTIRVRLDGYVQPLLERSADHRDGQRHIAEAGAVQVADVNVRASRGRTSNEEVRSRFMDWEGTQFRLL